MQKNDWKDRMTALLKRRGWDIKDWHRATGLNQWQLENLMEMDLSEMDEGSLEGIYEQAKEAKLDKSLLRFDAPVMIAVWAHKGGMGKSTVVTNLSYELAKKGYNVLAVDTDSQSDMSSVLYPDYIEEPDVSFYNAFLGQEDFKEEGYIMHTEYSGIDVVAGSAECEALEGALCMMTDKIRDKMWKKCLRSVREENYYDFIIIDMDKTAGVMNKTILAEADYVLAPIESSIFGVKSVPPTIAQIDEVAETNPKLKLLGVLFNKVDLRKKASMADNMELVEQIAPQCIFKTFIKNDANVDNSQKEHMPIGYYNSRSPASKQMTEFAEEAVERIRKDQNRKGE
jgi:chromosome partitioning protein